MSHTCDVALSPLTLTWLFAAPGQSLPSDLVGQKVEAVAGYVPQGHGQPPPEQTPGPLFPQDDGDTVDGSSVSADAGLILQTHLHQVDGGVRTHLQGGSSLSAVPPKRLSFLHGSTLKALSKVFRQKLE